MGPDSLAVTFEQQRLSYRELNLRANHLAHHLLITILAVFKAGGAYLPLDPHQPPARLRNILEHSGSGYILAAKKFASV